MPKYTLTVPRGCRARDRRFRHKIGQGEPNWGEGDGARGEGTELGGVLTLLAQGDVTHRNSFGTWDLASPSSRCLILGQESVLARFWKRVTRTRWCPSPGRMEGTPHKRCPQRLCPGGGRFVPTWGHQSCGVSPSPPRGEVPAAPSPRPLSLCHRPAPSCWAMRDPPPAKAGTPVGAGPILGSNPQK